MRKFVPVIYDVTHSVQKPGGQLTGAAREFCLPLAMAAAAVGVDGFFMEAHPESAQAFSDAASQLPLTSVPGILARLERIDAARA